MIYVKHYLLFSIVTLGFLEACAASPESIAPAYVSDMTYQAWTCEQMAQEQPRLSSALAAAYTQQSNARSNDTIGVIFLGLPVSTLSGGNMAGEVGRLKGELQAIQRAATFKNCSLPPIPAPS